MVEGGQRFRELRVWHEGMELARAIYDLTAQFPVEERYVELALGSLAEVETQLEIAADLSNRTRRADVDQRIVRTRRMLYRLLSALR